MLVIRRSWLNAPQYIDHDGQSKTSGTHIIMHVIALKLKRLSRRSLDLSHCPGADDEAIAGLACHERLTDLRLAGCAVSDASLSILARHVGLTTLHLDGNSGVGKAGLSILSCLTRLVSLGLRR